MCQPEKNDRFHAFGEFLHIVMREILYLCIRVRQTALTDCARRNKAHGCLRLTPHAKAELSVGTPLLSTTNATPVCVVDPNDKQNKLTIFINRAARLIKTIQIMKKIFLFAAAIVAAMTVNAKVVTFAEIVDNTAADAAKAAFDAGFEYENIETAGVANSAGDAYLVEIKQVDATAEWGVTTLNLKDEDQVYFEFKDSNAGKLVMKAYKEYVQPNGKAACLVITDLNAGDVVKITLKKALNKESLIEGATVTTHNFDTDVVELTAAASEIRVYSKNEAGDKDAKWQIVSVEVPGGQSAVENVNATVKSVKTIENGQVVIIKNGVKYNVLGAEVR